MNHLVWFKRDLRTVDNEALARAASQGTLLCLYIYEPDVIGGEDYDAAHLRFTNQCLVDLRERLRQLGGELILRMGDAVSVLESLHAEHGFDVLHSHQETGNDTTFQRDLRVKAWARQQNVEWREYLQHGVFRCLGDRNGWAARWNELMRRPMWDEPDAVTCVPIQQSGRIREPADFMLDERQRIHVQVGGAIEGHRTLDEFLNARGQDYRTEMSSPLSAVTSCSRLSPHLAYGSLSMRVILQMTEARQQRLRASRRMNRSKGDGWLDSLASFSKRLRWHCHFMQKLESQPSLEFENMARVYDGMREKHFRQSFFDAWCAGETGYPMVDACMRSLVATGWLNFRMRAMLMSFASYHLWLHWRPTALFLARQFIDYEPGIHYSQAQMQSGTTGINSVRIYSPIKQVIDQDPNGDFIRRWVPELAGVPSEFLSQPELMPLDIQQAAGCIIGVDYPKPIVEHKKAVAAAKNRIYGIRRQKGARDEARDVFVRHGSRRGPMRRRRPGG